MGTTVAPPATLGVVPKAQLERLLFQSATVAIGRFRCAADHPLFRDSGPSNAYCFVFPRTSVWIQHAGARPFVAHPGMVTFYNEGQEYSRRALGVDGDRAEWFALAPQVAGEILAQVAPQALGPGRRVFRDAYAPSDPVTYLRQRRLVEHLHANVPVDPLAVEEAVLSLLAAVARRTAVTKAHQPALSASRRQRDLVEQAKMLLAVTARQHVPLSDLAARLSCSMYHLCRTFLKFEGRTMTAYRNEVRLRMSLEAVLEGTDLSQIALEAGFSSHSHFTSAFRAHFGVTPSTARLARRSF